MRAAIALCSFFIMLAVGCGGTEQVTFTGADGKSVGVLDMDTRHVDQMRKGELDMRTQAVFGANGYLVNCGNVTSPYPGETTLHRWQWWSGDCLAAGSWSNGSFFSMNDPNTRWPSDGWFINNSVRSMAVRAPSTPNKRTQFHTMRESDGSGGGHDGLTHVNGTTAYGTMLTDAECTALYCPKPLESSSFYGYSYVP